MGVFSYEKGLLSWRLGGKASLEDKDTLHRVSAKKGKAVVEREINFAF
jgi:hypothetical protein